MTDMKKARKTWITPKITVVELPSQVMLGEGSTEGYKKDKNDEFSDE